MKQASKNKIICVTKVRVPLRLRVRNLFCPYVEFKHELEFEEIPPAYTLSSYIRASSIIHLLYRYLKRKLA